MESGGNEHEKTNELNITDNPLYHNTWTLLKNTVMLYGAWSYPYSKYAIHLRLNMGALLRVLDSIYLAGADLTGSAIERHAQCEQSHKMLKLLDTAIDLLRTKHKNGGLITGCCTTPFPTVACNVEEIIESCVHISGISAFGLITGDMGSLSTL